MNIKIKQFLVCCFVTVGLAGAGIAAGQDSCASRETLLMNYGWKFHKGELPVNHWGKYAKNGTYGTEPGIGLAYTNDAAWRAIDLPHDFTIEAFASDKGNVGHGYFPAEVGWYRRPFTIPASDKGRRITVEFEGAFQTTTLYCNNFIVGRHESGYAPFQFDITEFINYGGSNVLSVCVDGKLPEGWWYEGGGIYRDVYLVKTAPVHVPWGGVYVQSWFKVDPDGGRSFLEDTPEGPAHLRIQVAAANKGMARAEVKIRTRVLDPEGREVAEGSRRVEVGPGGETAASVEAKLRHPRLWSLEEPQLYTAVVELENEGRVVDRFEQTFGIRTIRFDANLGFFLNGKSLKIRGAANHQDHAGVGIALPDDVFAFRLKRLKEFGFNGYRTAHHPGGPVIRVADRLGMLVLAENRKFSTGEQAMKELRQLVLSCRNSPSVIAWNIGNEEVAFQHTPIGGQVARGMRDCVRSMDTTRPVAMGQNEGHEIPGSAATELDLIGFNYTWDTWDKIHKLYPDKPIIETEMARSYTSRGVYEKQELQGRLLSYDEKHNFSGGTFTLAEVKRQSERPWMCGGFIWTGFDYRGEPGPFFPNEWARCKMPGEVPHIVSCHFGAFDLCGFPKDGAFYYKAAYSAEPVVHVFPHWNWKGREGQPIDVWVYSNCDEIDLIVNGRSQGRKPMPKLGYLSWTVPYEAGAIEAIGFRNGAVVMRDKRETTGEPVAVALVPDRVELRANHEDVAVVTMQAVDAQGRPVPTATNTIRFRVEGPARLLGSGNGDAATREPDKVPVRSLWAGLAQVLVQSLDEPGKAVLIAESDGVKPARLELPITPAKRRPFLPSPVKADPAMWSDVRGRDKTAAPAPQDDYSFYGKNAVTNPEKAARDERH
jgi:beta-galactosidase